MSWDHFYYDKTSSCACGKGIVVKHCHERMDDWNRIETDCTGFSINCPDCKSKYHVEIIKRHYFCHPWDSDGICIKEYLVPNGTSIPPIITEKSNFHSNVKEWIVNTVTKQELSDVITDMVNSKYSTRVRLSQSKHIVSICSDALKTKSLKKVVPLLREILSAYDTFEWNPNTIAAYKKHESEVIRTNNIAIAAAISCSYELTFNR